MSHGREFLDELTQLAHGDLTLLEFYREMLPRLTRHLKAEGMAVWLCQGDQIKPFCRHGIGDATANGQRERHLSLLDKVRSAGQPAYVLPKSAESSAQWANPTEYLLGICPVKVDDSVVALLESYHQDAEPREREAGLRPLRTAAAIAGRFHHNTELRQLRQQRDWWNQFETFSQAAHASLDLRKAAYTIANEARLLIRCDRVSVFLRRGRSYRATVISGHDTINRRANTVVLLEELVARTMALGEPFSYPTRSAEELPPQVEAALDSYVDDSHCHELLICPLTSLDEAADEEAGPRHETPGVVGALVAEQFSTDAMHRELVPPVGRQAGSALSNAWEHQQIFLLPLWKAIGKISWLVSARNLPKTVSAAFAVLAIVLAVFLIPADFSLIVEGTLQPELRRHVFAQAEGVVDELFVRHGSQVRQGATLATLRSSDIDLSLLEVQGELEATAKKLAAAKAARVSLSASVRTESAQINQLAAEEEELRQWLANLRDQQRLLRERQEMLVVQSPLDGEVATWDVENLLTARPVQRGAILMTIAKTDGPWVLELQLPDKSVGHLRTARDDLTPQLPVSFILATNPSQQLEGMVKRVGLSTVSSEELGLYLPVTVELEESNIPQLRAGAKVIARIHCGRRAVGYVWFRQVLEFLQTHVLFRFS